MTIAPAIPQLVQQKLEAFEHIQSEFEECFAFVQSVHGQKRFPAFPVSSTVHYLHALWICECKGRLLSVAKTVKEYEGRYCLELLRQWQEQEDTASVVAFLHRKLDMLPLADITRQVHEARRLHVNDGMAHRLEHGRLILLNRGINLMQALQAIFELPEEDLFREVSIACEQYGHRPVQIERQLQQMDSPLYEFAPHQVLAQRNMVVMNKLGINVALRPADLPGVRSWRVVAPIEPLSPFAEHVVVGYQELITPWHNNPKEDRFVDRPER